MLWLNVITLRDTAHTQGGFPSYHRSFPNDSLPLPKKEPFSLLSKPTSFLPQDGKCMNIHFLQGNAVLIPRIPETVTQVHYTQSRIIPSWLLYSTWMLWSIQGASSCSIFLILTSICLEVQESPGLLLGTTNSQLLVLYTSLRDKQRLEIFGISFWDFSLSH